MRFSAFPRRPRVLVACEYSGVVRDAFRSAGCDAWSCDLLPCDASPVYHFRRDVREVIAEGWDLMIAHPPCTYLCASGMHWTRRGLRDPALTEEALAFVQWLLSAPVPFIALENPVGVISTRLRRPDCIIQPWQHGHAESKATCLWLKALPPLVPSCVMPLPPGGRWLNQTPGGQNKLPPSADRWKIRSRTYEGIAAAMVAQWLPVVEKALTCSSA